MQPATVESGRRHLRRGWRSERRRHPSEDHESKKSPRHSLRAIQIALPILGSADAETPLSHAGLNLQVDNIEERQALIEAHGGQLLQLREPGGNVPDRVAGSRDTR